MNTHLNILILEDHQIIIDVYKKVIEVVNKNLETYMFSVFEAKNCDKALEIIQQNVIDIVFLDIQIPSSSNKSIVSGEVFGIKMKNLFPKTKIIICTSLNDNLRLNNIFKSVNPDSFLTKSDIDFDDLVSALKNVIFNKKFYSNTILEFLKNQQMVVRKLE